MKRKTRAAGEKDKKPDAKAVQINNEIDGSGEQKNNNKEDNEEKKEREKEIRKFRLGRNFQIFIDLIIFSGYRGTF